MKTLFSDRILLFVSITSLLLSIVLFSWHAWLSFVHIADWEEKVRIEEQGLADLQLQQDALMSAEVRQFLNQYSDSVVAIESVFAARDEFFSGEMTADRFEPVVILDLLSFFESLRERLSSRVLVNKISLSPTGELNFLVQSTSYRQAAQQLQVFQYGLLSDGLPQLFRELSVSSVSKTKLSLARQDELPDLLQGRDASFDFFVKMQISPEYFRALAEQTQQLQENPITS
jgi:hypothetical protein